MWLIPLSSKALLEIYLKGEFYIHAEGVNSRPMLAIGFIKEVFYGSKPRMLIGDKAYDSDPFNESLMRIGMELIAPHKHNRINHSKLFADNQNHINGIENFWNQAKRQLRKFNGIKQEHFYWFLKECEWRFNGGNHQSLLKQLKYWVKRSKQ